QPALPIAAPSRQYPRRCPLLCLGVEEFEIAIRDRKRVHITVTNFRAVRRWNARDDLASGERAFFQIPVEDAFGAEVLAMRNMELIVDMLARSICYAGR